MHPKGAYNRIGRIVDVSVIPRTWPVDHNLEFLSSQVDTARHSRLASTNRGPYSNRTNGAMFHVMSLNFPRDQRIISVPNSAVSKRSGPTLTGVTIGGILASCFAILLLLLVPCYLKRRRRRAESARAYDMEHGHSRQSSFASTNHKALSISHLDCLPLSNSNPAPPVSQPSSKRVAFVGIPTPASSDVKERIRKPPRPAPPPPLLIPLRRTDYEVLQGDSSETAVPINPPASLSSRVTGERVRKPSLPTRPPPLILHPERVVRKAPKINSNTVGESRTIIFANEGNRDSVGSLLPNPWDSGAKPQHATYELPILLQPSFTGSVHRANVFKAGLPRTPRKTRTLIPSKVRQPHPARI